MLVVCWMEIEWKWGGSTSIFPHYFSPIFIHLFICFLISSVFLFSQTSFISTLFLTYSHSPFLFHSTIFPSSLPNGPLEWCRACLLKMELVICFPCASCYYSLWRIFHPSREYNMCWCWYYEPRKSCLVVDGDGFWHCSKGHGIIWYFLSCCSTVTSLS